MIDKSQFFGYYSQGLNDVEIGRKCNCSTETVRKWRVANGLQKNFSYETFRKTDYKEVQELVGKGLSDREVAEKTGSVPITVYFIRKKNGFQREDLHIAKEIPLTDVQKAFLIGTVLGDSSLTLPKKGKNVSMSCEHGISQREYALWKSNLLESLSPKYKEYTRNSQDSRNGIYYTSATIRLNANPALNEWYSSFYKDGKKVIPAELLYRYYNDFSLAVHFMDDGTKANSTYVLCTNCFTNKEVDMFRDFLKNRFEIETTRKKSNEVYILARSRETFERVVCPYIIPSMKYKLHCDCDSVIENKV